jgi:hypothetical protein
MLRCERRSVERIAIRYLVAIIDQTKLELSKYRRVEAGQKEDRCVSLAVGLAVYLVAAPAADDVLHKTMEILDSVSVGQADYEEPIMAVDIESSKVQLANFSTIGDLPFHPKCPGRVKSHFRPDVLEECLARRCAVELSARARKACHRGECRGIAKTFGLDLRNAERCPELGD